MARSVIRLPVWAVPNALVSSPASRGYPEAVVVGGPSAEWRAAAARPAFSAVLRTYAGVTVAIAPPREVTDREMAEVLEPFDLVAEADDTRLAAWLAAIERFPLASTVLAQLLRLPVPSLDAESFAYSMLQAGPEHAAWLATHRPRPITDRSSRVRAANMEGVREVRLTRGDKHNALDMQMRAELVDALATLEDHPEVPLVLVGDGPSFCSGGDLDEFGLRDDPVRAHFVRAGSSPAASMLRLGARAVVGIHGAAVGAGIELAAFAGRVVAATDLRARLPELGFGLLPGSGGTVGLVRRIGRRALLDLVLRAEVVDARTALELGMVDELVPPEALLASVHSAARALLRA